MNPIELKIEALIKQLDQRKEKAVSSARINAVVYGILVIFVFGYTTYIYHMIQKVATPDSISAMIRSQISSAIPDVHKKLMKYAEEQTPVMTEKIIQMAHDKIPEVEKKIQDTIDEQTTSFIKEIKKDLFPEFMDILKGHAKEIGENAKILTDEVAAQELVNTITKELDDKINYEIVGDEFFGKFHEVRKELDNLATKPLKDMTRKELAERNAIVNWYYLIHNGESLNSVLGSYVSNIGLTFQSIMDGTFFLESRPSDISAGILDPEVVE